ncbi:hypothetical protein A2870_03285 [Candidatus Curtissbacteria bacterium RIFCSPHIGHO2_01_FULL_41_11]|uniref:Uncharacterized protein n=1 Tax=Candidatus Curtissbacteria bacterium RIFCSPHIGHO2_01_FULL_41_11 TaxID=1797711 RepID=A0A1F5G4W2_9BACT|nr:MAG: hypothetical protein A2870_03285 [Candidatus Curtissbacteria bacterium RIFCSPHIGHO2_01_FULL_41_11]
MLPVRDFKIGKKVESNFNLVGKIKVKLIVLFTFFAGTLIFTQLVFANNLATDGNKLSSINEEIAKFERENTTLKVQIAQESSLTVLSQKAKEAGFEKPTKVIVP